MDPLIGQNVHSARFDMNILIFINQTQQKTRLTRNEVSFKNNESTSHNTFVSSLENKTETQLHF